MLLPPDGFENEYIDDEFFDDEEGKFTCWSELDGGCYLIHTFLAEAAICYIVRKSQILEIQEKDIYKYWSTYIEFDDMLVIVDNESPNFEISNEEIEYLMDLEDLEIF